MQSNTRTQSSSEREQTRYLGVDTLQEESMEVKEEATNVDPGAERGKNYK